MRAADALCEALKAEGVIPFPKSLKLKPGETVIFAAVEFKSEAHRNATMKKIQTGTGMPSTLPARNEPKALGEA